MVSRGCSLLFMLAFCASSQTVPSPAARAKEFLDFLLAEKYPALIQLLTPEMKKGLPIEVLRDKISPGLKQLGKAEKIEAARTEKSGQFTIVVIPVEFAVTAVNMQITVDAAGLIAGFYVRPPDTPVSTWKSPAYSNPAAFREREITVGEGDWKLPGTLTIPTGTGPFPAVVLVHGSGPNDRDETVLSTKVFKDLAEGLASKGIAVLRYDKRTKVHGAKMTTVKNLTVREETIDDAIKAAALARTQPEIIPKRVFILGHSLGGYLAPRIGLRDDKLAGLVLLAGSTRPLEDMMLEQTEYLASLQPQQNETVRKQVASIRAMVERIRKLEPGKETDEIFLGMQSPYLLDLRGYNPPAEAKKLTLPMLILQGERDYQVTMKDFSNWKTALQDRKNVTLRSYPALNHLFIAGEGKSTPTEYQKPLHVDVSVVNDIVKWIAAVN